MLVFFMYMLRFNFQIENIILSVLLISAVI